MRLNCTLQHCDVDLAWRSFFFTEWKRQQVDKMNRITHYKQLMTIGIYHISLYVHRQLTSKVCYYSYQINSIMLQYMNSLGYSCHIILQRFFYFDILLTYLYGYKLIPQILYQFLYIYVRSTLKLLSSQLRTTPKMKR